VLEIKTVQSDHLYVKGEHLFVIFSLADERPRQSFKSGRIHSWTRWLGTKRAWLF